MSYSRIYCVPLLLLSACGEVHGGSTVVAHDSAGIQIVESTAAAWSDGEGWRVSDQPVLDIGVVEGDPRYQMFRVTGASLRPDGGVAVANAGSGEIRIFDREGRFVRAVGGDGEGPGEFRILYGVWPFRGDSLLAWDMKLRRASVFAPNGDFTRLAPLAQSSYNPVSIGPFADGSLLSMDQTFESPESGVRQQFANYLRHSPEGALLDSLGTFPTFRSAPVRWPDGGTLVGREGFGASTSVAASRDRFFVGLGSAYEVGEYTPDGTLARLIRWRGPQRAVTADDVERYKEEEIGRAEDEEERRRERVYLSQIPFAAEFPAYSDLRADRSGNLWVRVYDRPGHSGPARWLVFDTSGGLLGEVRTPEDLRILEIGDDYVLGVGRDEFDVEHVRKYALRKN